MMGVRGKHPSVEPSRLLLQADGGSSLTEVDALEEYSKRREDAFHVLMGENFIYSVKII